MLGIIAVVWISPSNESDTKKKSSLLWTKPVQPFPRKLNCDLFLFLILQMSTNENSSIKLSRLDWYDELCSGVPPFFCLNHVLNRC